ncbi:uncharacterized protein PGTG_14035 [Puccinia graminis f. sp. tritici CRL 75-36-700-3]|uniref:Cyanovirin-N domain-containing protein n=1 Tax=Puccinia graminis f. sp. tritici (strain CRL 75-36-700-3 / race SCCL) TaxID=418459 RepID=E3KVY2_PUCGT|nr:uncharacterized protein PGTG_14035 [Puccinia graminis f. sp. tritici CRL 75-36-700-3]EFP88457.1 hypothetical protein PGTG_14035 [Puccinia graminis f. sp. tritici CRL 75-36-700-3]
MRLLIRILPVLMVIIRHGASTCGDLSPFQCPNLDKAQGLCAQFISNVGDYDDSTQIFVTTPGVDGIQFTCDNLDTKAPGKILNQCCLTHYELGNVHTGQFVSIDNATFSATCIPP